MAIDTQGRRADEIVGLAAYLRDRFAQSERSRHKDMRQRSYAKPANKQEDQANRLYNLFFERYISALLSGTTPTYSIFKGLLSDLEIGERISIITSSEIPKIVNENIIARMNQILAVTIQEAVKVSGGTHGNVVPQFGIKTISFLSPPGSGKTQGILGALKTLKEQNIIKNFIMYDMTQHNPVTAPLTGLVPTRGTLQTRGTAAPAVLKFENASKIPADILSGVEQLTYSSAFNLVSSLVNYIIKDPQINQSLQMQDALAYILFVSDNVKDDLNEVSLRKNVVNVLKRLNNFLQALRKQSIGIAGYDWSHISIDPAQMYVLEALFILYTLVTLALLSLVLSMVLDNGLETDVLRGVDSRYLAVIDTIVFGVAPWLLDKALSTNEDLSPYVERIKANIFSYLTGKAQLQTGELANTRELLKQLADFAVVVNNYVHLEKMGREQERVSAFIDHRVAIFDYLINNEVPVQSSSSFSKRKFSSHAGDAVYIPRTTLSYQEWRERVRTFANGDYDPKTIKMWVQALTNEISGTVLPDIQDSANNVIMTLNSIRSLLTTDNLNYDTLVQVLTPFNNLSKTILEYAFSYPTLLNIKTTQDTRSGRSKESYISIDKTVKETVVQAIVRYILESNGYQAADIDYEGVTTSFGRDIEKILSYAKDDYERYRQEVISSQGRSNSNPPMYVIFLDEIMTSLTPDLFSNWLPIWPALINSFSHEKFAPNVVLILAGNMPQSPEILKALITGQTQEVDVYLKRVARSSLTAPGVDTVSALANRLNIHLVTYDYRYLMQLSPSGYNTTAAELVKLLNGETGSVFASQTGHSLLNSAILVNSFNYYEAIVKPRLTSYAASMRMDTSAEDLMRLQACLQALCMPQAANAWMESLMQDYRNKILDNFDDKAREVKELVGRLIDICYPASKAPTKHNILSYFIEHMKKDSQLAYSYKMLLSIVLSPAVLYLASSHSASEWNNAAAAVVKRIQQAIKSNSERGLSFDQLEPYYKNLTMFVYGAHHINAYTHTQELDMQLDTQAMSFNSGDLAAVHLFFVVLSLNYYLSHMYNYNKNIYQIMSALGEYAKTVYENVNILGVQQGQLVLKLENILKTLILQEYDPTVAFPDLYQSYRRKYEDDAEKAKSMLKQEYVIDGEMGYRSLDHRVSLIAVEAGGMGRGAGRPAYYFRILIPDPQVRNAIMGMLLYMLTHYYVYMIKSGQAAQIETQYTTDFSILINFVKYFVSYIDGDSKTAYHIITPLRNMTAWYSTVNLTVSGTILIMMLLAHLATVSTGQLHGFIQDYANELTKLGYNESEIIRVLGDFAVTLNKFKDLVFTPAYSTNAYQLTTYKSISIKDGVVSDHYSSLETYHSKEAYRLVRDMPAVHNSRISGEQGSDLVEKVRTGDGMSIVKYYFDYIVSDRGLWGLDAVFLLSGIHEVGTIAQATDISQVFLLARDKVMGFECHTDGTVNTGTITNHMSDFLTRLQQVLNEGELSKVADVNTLKQLSQAISNMPTLSMKLFASYQETTTESTLSELNGGILEKIRNAKSQYPKIQDLVQTYDHEKESIVVFYNKLISYLINVGNESHFNTISQFLKVVNMAYQVLSQKASELNNQDIQQCVLVMSQRLASIGSEEVPNIIKVYLTNIMRYIFANILTYMLYYHENQNGNVEGVIEMLKLITDDDLSDYALIEALSHIFEHIKDRLMKVSDDEIFKSLSDRLVQACYYHYDKKYATDAQGDNVPYRVSLNQYVYKNRKLYCNFVTMPLSSYQVGGVKVNVKYESDLLLVNDMSVKLPGELQNRSKHRHETLLGPNVVLIPRYGFARMHIENALLVTLLHNISGNLKANFTPADESMGFVLTSMYHYYRHKCNLVGDNVMDLDVPTFIRQALDTKYPMHPLLAVLLAVYVGFDSVVADNKTVDQILTEHYGEASAQRASTGVSYQSNRSPLKLRVFADVIDQVKPHFTLYSIIEPAATFPVWS